ncbi:MAG: 4-hydroxy-tetrahydrodipicolinate synthase [Candidatus Nanopelagicales bacterium]|jgi:4-hydroxy-tetrahydrodipicolinate synthase|nr:4-hydroxy-tetrahydrodipicolinate synthase [Actinomycetota bacterium]
MNNANRPFGTVLTAMITPFTKDDKVDIEGAARLAKHLVELGNDGIVVNGTTGESATTTEIEKNQVLKAVLEEVGSKAKVVAGVGSNDTAHTVGLAKDAAKLGAHGVLVVTPYYNKPTQAGVYAHFKTVADATDLPLMMYDIPGRAGIPIETETLLRLSEHPRIVANKDAKNNLEAASKVIKETNLAWYSGEDALNLPLLSIGAIGFVSVCGHLIADRLKEMSEAFFSNNFSKALEIHQNLLPIYTGVMSRMPGVMSIKAALRLKGLPAGAARLPLVDADEKQIEQLRADLLAGGLKI